MSDNRNGDSLSMIVVMGVTGSGKSYFINKLADGNVVKTGDDLHSCKSRHHKEVMQTFSKCP